MDPVGNFIYGLGRGDAGSWIFYLFIAVVIFFAIREILTWYWKINRMVDLLEQIEENTRKNPVTTKTELTTPQIKQ